MSPVPPFRARRSGGVAAMTPDEVSGLFAWYDATDGSTVWQDIGRTTPAADGLLVRAMDDKSGNARHIEQASALASSISYSSSGFGPNSLASVDFNGAVWSFLATTGAHALPANQLTFIMLYQSRELTANFSYGFGHVTEANGIYQQLETQTGDGPGFFDGAHKDFNIGAVVNDEIVGTWLYSATDAKFYNGLTQQGDTIAHSNFSAAAGQLKFGRANDCDCKLVKLAVYNVELAEADWQAVAQGFLNDAGL